MGATGVRGVVRLKAGGGLNLVGPVAQPPRSWNGAGVRAWGQRRQPRNPRALFRGFSPRQLSYPQLDCAYLSSPVLHLGVGAGKLLTVGIHFARWLSFHPMRVWGAAAPLGSGAGWVSSRLGSVLISNRRVLALGSFLVRGLGGLCRLKLRYRGKSFRWHRRRGGLLLRFGHSHLVAIPTWPSLRWRRFGRSKILLYGSDWWSLVMFAQVVCWWRPINVYHGRGLRLRRQVVLRKAGKVSTFR